MGIAEKNKLSCELQRKKIKLLSVLQRSSGPGPGSGGGQAGN
jgi:hypothetical protein